MHIEKNIYDSVLGTLMSIDRKTKDTYNIWLDLESMGVMCNLHSTCKDYTIYIPLTYYMLNEEEKKKFCKFLCSIKLSDGYFSISLDVSMSMIVKVLDSKVTIVMFFYKGYS